MSVKKLLKIYLWKRFHVNYDTIGPKKGQGVQKIQDRYIGDVRTCTRKFPVIKNKKLKWKVF